MSRSRAAGRYGAVWDQPEVAPLSKPSQNSTASGCQRAM